MLSATALSLSYGTQNILDDVSLTIDSATRAGLVGANGSGKTSLLRILAGKERGEGGKVIAARDAIIEYLPQRNAVPLERTVYSFADEGYERDHDLLEQRNRAADRLAANPHDENGLAVIAEIDHHLEHSGYYRRQEKIGRVLDGLGFTSRDYDRPLAQFSGGWRMRAALAKSLLTRPHILLLDEPTNYLDSEARLWLGNFLRSFDGGFVVVSHDRAFLDDTVDTILELFSGKVRRYRGSYTEYENRRSEELRQLVDAWEAQQREIARQEEFIRRFRANANKARQVQSRVKALEKVELIEIPEHLRPIHIVLPPPVHSGKTVLSLSEVNKSYGSLHVLEDLSLTLTRGQRLAVVGLNGAGKSTLLRLLSGSESPDDGEIRTGTGVEIAYFAQDSADHLPADETILQYVTARAHDQAVPRVRDILGSFLFSGDSVDKPLGVLSGGERSRVAMATLLVRSANLLILDEPTNHLDMTSQEVLAKALSRYEGTVVFVSHDRHFLRSIATDVLALWPSDRSDPAIPRNRWQLYPGSYREFEGASLGRVFLLHSAMAENSGPAESAGNDASAKDFAEQKRLRSELRKIEKREEELLNEIDRMESQHRQLQDEISRPEIYTDGRRVRDLTARLEENEQIRADLHREWEDLEEQRNRVVREAES